MHTPNYRCAQNVHILKALYNFFVNIYAILYHNVIATGSAFQIIIYIPVTHRELYIFITLASYALWM